ncbi:glycoside hydrolase family 31 protein [Chitinophagaceae bacterium LB-8]|uniref:Glycoside hydrolase family 31 protein n=1 Tax=Paraflavisolibacter caeni TaxID=2982496 RepID=A0A9X2XQ48_9BACT|nr:TIM-barrel domain-containing protein [Paraflavisolibacter caeni]MCU7552629.1 glycoside hydrolase family 31 protein [Paraflavisolibacter caeni]
MIKNPHGKLSLLSFLLLLITHVGLCQNFTKTNTGIKTSVDGLTVEVQFFNSRIVRVIKAPEGTSFNKQSLSVIKTPAATPLQIQQQGNAVLLKSEALQVALDLQTGKVAFSNLNGGLLFTEKDYGSQFTAIKDVNKNTYSVRQAFRLDKDEVIYGLGQQQNGKMNQRGQKVFLRQDNTKVCIPFFQSVKGYGVFWDNYAPTTFLDNPHETSFDSEVGDGSDYYFLYGGSADGVIAQMRDLTGQAPLMPLWVYGFNQSRERYRTQYELLNVVKKYRSLKVPLDGIIQDWQYWGKDSNWNAMSFEPSTYPRPKELIDSVHQLNAHIFFVAWPGFGPNTPQYKELKEKKMLLNFETYPPRFMSTPYDVYNPMARDIYWRYLDKGVFSLNSDAWWLDSSEPDHSNLKESDFDLPTYLGTFRSVRNAFPLQHVGGVYDHQRQSTSDKRVMILTRSAFAGQQRYGANTWSGDVHSNWETLRKQVPAGLNFSLCGIPYWNTDIGGFIGEGFPKGAKNPEFQELYTRWMQFATFTPMMRSHGTSIPREIYQFGNRGEWPFDVQEKFINLRYQLLPYLYATAWDVTSHSGSIIRALYMDFVNDKKVYDIDNEYLFGKSFLVSPVTDKGTTTQSVYLPAGAVWYDFWTGERTDGGKAVDKATPIDIIPLYVKGGSIVPWGPKVQYAEEKKWNNLELRIYPGADAAFTLYEDENNNYNYEQGKYAEITFNWNDQARTLTIKDRKGSFPGMLSTRKFNIVLVNNQNSKTITYKGKEVTAKF